MGITRTDCTLLFHARSLGVNYRKTCMLGRLHLYVTQEEINACIARYNQSVKSINAVNFTDGYSEPLFEILGAHDVQSIDYSAYEKATIIHDLNNPLPEEFNHQFSCMIDGGTIEHIFNFPVAIKSCMDAIEVGGHYIGISPANNQMGHGFYQFSPELYYRIFSEENGFRIKTMLVSVDNEADTVWYEVADPKKVHSRVMLVNNYPLSLRFVAEKIAQKDVFANTPQQSDYTNTWNAYASVSENKSELSESKLKYLYRKFLPHRAKVILRNLYNIYHNESVQTKELGNINPTHFRQVDI